MMAAGLSMAGLAGIVGYASLHHRPAASQASAQPVAAPSPSALGLARAARDIQVGETIAPALVHTALGDVTRNPTIATPGEAIGKVATRVIPAGSLIDRTMIDARTKLAIRVPVGMRAMSISTTAEIAVAGLIRPGDSVDVQTVYPGEDAIIGARGTTGRSHEKTLLQMVPVLAVGELVLGTTTAKANNSTNENALTSAARTVTLALTPAQVSTLSLAKNVGTLSLSLRNPNDKDVGAELASAGSDEPRPPSAPRPMRKRVRVAAEPAVQIMVGGRRAVAQ